MLSALMEPETMPAFLDAVAATPLVVPTAEPITTGGSRRVRFPVIRVGDREGVPAYTSMTRLARARPQGGPLVRMSGRELAAAWDHDRSLLINGGAELGLALDADAVRGLAVRE
jgi:hypothetical protein